MIRPNQTSSDPEGTGPSDDIAAAFVSARLAARPLERYPGPIPDSLPSAYACQARAISLWPDQVAGWKVGSIRPDIAKREGHNRLIGPIFGKSIRRIAPGKPMEFRTFPGGFAAAEPEYVLRLGQDVDTGREHWTVEAARELVDAVFRGVEIAGSPFAAINELGPAVVVSDFGNNDGLIVGEPLEGWQDLSYAEWSSRLYIDGVLRGEGSADDLVGGPFESLRYALEQVFRMGLTMKVGDLISTGAITGVHRVYAGQRIRAEFAGDYEIECVAV